MSNVAATSAADVHAPIEVVFGHAADFERMRIWQPDLKVVDIISRDEAGRAARVYMELETPLRRAKASLRITYAMPRLVSWMMIEGNVPAFEGSWKLAPVTELITRVEYEVVIDFGKLGRLVRGAAAGLLRDGAVSSMPHKLKTHVELLESSPHPPVISPGR